MWADRESENDFLNFGEVSELAVSALTSQGMLPISMGVFGNWGAGKSSLLKLIEQDLRKKDENYLIVTFDAWLYQGYDDARAALLEVIVTELESAAGSNKKLLLKIRNLLSRVNKFRLMGLAAEGLAFASGFPTGGIIARGFNAVSSFIRTPEEDGAYASLANSTKEIKEEIDHLLPHHTPDTPPKEIREFRKEYNAVLEDIGRPLILVIDNLDRCLPANAINTLEAIRLFLFLNNTAFIIAADEDMIRFAVSEYFKGSTARHQTDYLDKIIQMPIRVPKAGIREIRAYLFMLYAIDCRVQNPKLENLRKELELSLQNSWYDEPISKEKALELTGKKSDISLRQAYEIADRIAPILATSPRINGNPRIVKRLLNTVKMRSFIAKKRGIPLDEATITKLVIFERCAGVEATESLYSLIDIDNGKPAVIQEIEQTKEKRLPTSCPESWKKTDVENFIIQWAKISPSLANIDLRPAVYLSRETMPVGYSNAGLSEKGKEQLKALLAVSSPLSENGKTLARSIAENETTVIMEELVNTLKGVSSFDKKPSGFDGACILASVAKTTIPIFTLFLHSISKKPVWMNTSLKNQEWYKG